MKSPSSCDELLSSLRRQGVQLWVEGGELRFKAPKGALPAEARDELRRNRDEIICRLGHEGISEEIPLIRRPPGCRVPLTAMQKRRWSRRNEERRYRLRTGVIATRVAGQFDSSLLQTALEKLIQRHEPLRTRIVPLGEIPYQQIDEPHPHYLHVIDLSGMTDGNAENALKDLLEEFTAEEVEFSIGPMFATRLFKLSDTEHIFVIAFNHMISDAVSNEILRKEIWTQYDILSRADQHHLPPLELQFADYAVWQEDSCHLWMKKHATYWRGRLQDARPTKFPDDLGLPQSQPVGAQFELHLGLQLSNSIRQMAQRQQCMLPLVVLSIYLLLVSSWCVQRDLLVRLISNARYRPELETMIGFVANHLYLRLELRPNDTFLDFMKRVQLEFYAAYDHLDFDRVPDLVPQCRNTDLCFNWASENRWFMERPQETVGKLTLQSYPLSSARVVDFMPFFFDGSSGITGTVLYRSDRFSLTTARWLEAEFGRFSERCVQNPSVRLELILPTRGRPLAS